jgi:hypothetical protein
MIPFDSFKNVNANIKSVIAGVLAGGSAKKIASNPSLRFTRPGLHRPRRLRDDDNEKEETFVVARAPAPRPLSLSPAFAP